MIQRVSAGHPTLRPGVVRTNGYGLVSVAVRSTRKSLYDLAVAVGLFGVGCMLWVLHAIAWDVGARSPILDFETSRSALAARLLSDEGRLATTFALPIELVDHARPPWPIRMTAPGPVLLNALLFRITPISIELGNRTLATVRRPDQREWLTLVPPFLAFILLPVALALVTLRILRRYAVDLVRERRGLAGFVVGFVLMLDPESQIYASGGFGELPFTLLLGGAIAMLALDRAPQAPLRFGLLLGVAGLFRSEMAWIAPLFALAAAWLALPRGHGPAHASFPRVLFRSLLGFTLVLAPWWLYQWRTLGAPGADLGHLLRWDGVAGRTWFALTHVCERPVLPTGLAAVGLLFSKALGNAPSLVLALLTGPRALWLGALLVWLVAARAPRPLRIGGLAVMAALGIGVIAAALGSPAPRVIFPARAIAEAAGLLALWHLIAWIPGPSVTGRRVLTIAVSVLALCWNFADTIRLNTRASRSTAERQLPATVSLLQIAVLMNREIPAGEAVMSNLGPTLAWHARRPVIDLAATPDDVEGCRHRLDFRHVLLVFREPGPPWTAWTDLIVHPRDAARLPDWNITRARTWTTGDGFTLIWLELGPLRERLAEAGSTEPRPGWRGLQAAR